MLSDMGTHLWAFRMSVDMMHLAKDDPFDEVEDVINVSEFHRALRRSPGHLRLNRPPVRR